MRSPKNKEPGVDIHLVSYITSVDHNVLDMFVERQYIKKHCVEDVTDQLISHVLYTTAVDTLTDVLRRP